MATLYSLVLSIADWMWGWPIIGLSVATAVVLTIRLKGFQFRYFGHCVKETGKGIFGKKGDEGTISSWQACCSALGATLGVGNIAGVSVAIAIGGPGAVFWMWFIALLGMIVKYAEIVLSVDSRVKDEDGIYRGGLMWYVHKRLPKLEWLGITWCVFLCINLVFGPAIQTHEISNAASTFFPVPLWLLSGIIAVLMAVILFGGLKRIASFADKCIPFMAIIYVAVSLFVIFRNIANVPAAFGLIFKGAFNGTAASGGFVGSSVAIAARWGVARGVFSNEAGNGLAALVHSSANVDHPSEQGLWGIVEVFVDTIIICTMTAMVVLTTGVWDNGLEGAALTTSAFAVGFGSEKIAGFVITVVILLFGFTTAVVNMYQGERCWSYLIRNFRHKKIAVQCYRFLGCFFALVGGIYLELNVWGLEDFTSGAATLMSLFTLLLLSGRVKELTEGYVEKIKAKKNEEVSKTE